MKKEIFINSTLSETRIALVENAVLQQIHIDRQENPSLVGNIYKAKVLRVMPGMQAAFVDIGLERNAFIHIDDIHRANSDNKITDKNFPIALDFKRKVNDHITNIYHHIGIYAFKPEILKKIVNLKQTKNEIKNRLEQLRAIENKIKINVALAKFSSIGIDTMDDYLALKKFLEYKY